MDPPVIVAVAGAVVTDPAAREALRDGGHVVWLKARPETLLARIGSGDGRRDEAIEVVNSSRFGNGVSIFTESGASVRRFRHEVEVGMIGVNIGVAAPVAFFPFSGWKDSFLGDLHAHGPDAVEFYTRKKTVTSRWFASGQGHGQYFVEK
jgi:hypothetical protein